MSNDTVSWPFTEGEHSPDETVPADDLFDLLSDEYRRDALRCLLRLDGPISVDELVDRVTAERDDAGSVASEMRITTLFHHAHLPKMDDLDVIEYDPGRRKIEPTALLTEIEPVLRTY
jgi:hypothetical protein